MDAETLTSMVESVKVMQLRPTDVVVIRLTQIASDHVRTAIKEHLKPIFGDHKILVIDGSADIEIVRPEECPA